MNDKEFDNKLQEISNSILGNALSEEEETSYTETLFESIKHINEYNQEFWYARELQGALEYKEWRNFNKVIDKAKEACKGSENSILDHFVDVNKIVKAGVAQKEIEDIQLSRYACYLIVQNGDTRKKVIALGQTYFAVKTRQQELIENFDNLDEDKKRLAIRHEMTEHNKLLVAAANLFRATQTEAKLKRENIQGKEKANQTHYEVGQKVRQTIADIGGTMPEDLQTPEKSIKQIEKEMKIAEKSKKK